MYVPGTLLLWLAFLLGLASTVAYAFVIRGDEKARSYARQAYGLMTAAIVVASGLLMYLLVTHDYRLHYVWAYSDNLLPLKYLISSLLGRPGGQLSVVDLLGSPAGIAADEIRPSVRVSGDGVLQPHPAVADHAAPQAGRLPFSLRTHFRHDPHGRPGSQPAASEPVDGDPSADHVHRVRLLGYSVFVCSGRFVDEAV